MSRTDFAYTEDPGQLAPAQDPVARRRLWWILGTALALRLVFAFVVFPIIQPMTGLAHGSDGYEHIGATLADGGGYRFAADLGPTMYLVPAYPFFLAGLFLLTSHHLIVAQLAHCLLDTLSCYLIYRIGERSLDRRTGLAGAALYAIYPGAMVACSRFLTEPLFVCLALSFVYLFARFLDSGRKGVLIGSGLALAAAVLCKSVAGMLPVFLLVCGLVVPAWKPIRRRALGGLLVVSLIAGLGVTPWVYRNYQLTGTPVYPSTSGGLALYTASVYASRPDQSIGDSVDQSAAEVRALAASHNIRLDDRDSYPRWFYNPQEELALDRLTLGIARERIFAEPGSFVRHVAGNLWRFWLGAPSRLSMIFAAFCNLPLLALGVVGCFTSRWWTSRGMLLAVAVAAYLFLAHVAVLAVVRYALTVMPIVCLFAGAAVVRLGRFTEWGSASRETVGSAS